MSSTFINNNAIKMLVADSDIPLALIILSRSYPMTSTDIYIKNKYTAIYYNIIESRKNRILDGYTENHHIIPKSLNGSDNKENLIRLTAKEHYVLHHLLTKMVEGKSKTKMTHAFWRMNNSTIKEGLRITSRLYEHAKKLRSDNMKGKNNPFYGKKHSDEFVKWITEHNKNYRFTEQQKQKLSATMSGAGNPMFGKNHTNETKNKIGNANRGRIPSIETRLKLSESLTGKTPKCATMKTQCPHCNVIMDIGNAKRYHFDNCKFNPNYVPKPKRTYNKLSSSNNKS